MKYEQKEINAFEHRDQVRASNPLGRIPALVLDTGEVLADSAAIIDHLDEMYGRESALMPPAGAERRAVLRIAAMMMGTCDKLLAGAYERNRKPADKQHQPWIEDCFAQATHALKAVDAMIEKDARYSLFGRLTQADVCAFVAERLARGLGIDTDAQTPRLRALTRKLLDEEAFRATEP
jgi:glutathione S-transferase